MFIPVLLLGNMALITGIVNYLNPQQRLVKEKSLISSVQAEMAPVVNRPVGLQTDSRLLLPPQTPITQHATAFQTTPLEQQTYNKHILLHFQRDQALLTSTESLQLKTVLKQLIIRPAQRIQIVYGTDYADGSPVVLSTQTPKLRAHYIARFIHPYTEKVMMVYRPSLPEGTVIIEFLPAS
ncbi:hypothetical protein [Beggiatoa leptomitoformis]|uniref:Uncharacterized protein n=1 Tax=Beggiatoa leptomitoformis TaxID=288004 RepID=A0A2N9YAM6_9GAMM|nr:hypothetical protein [Beggiatoa leptomitoformis]ALG67105.2 hypothetical protein AL038_04485 [Beggiatoa leptomitoformis]AUI67502.2 hypothetical protein BLE401_01520 [Beggiatoa leptomitoformis]